MGIFLFTKPTCCNVQYSTLKSQPFWKVGNTLYTKWPEMFIPVPWSWFFPILDTGSSTGSQIRIRNSAALFSLSLFACRCSTGSGWNGVCTGVDKSWKYVAAPGSTGSQVRYHVQYYRLHRQSFIFSGTGDTLITGSLADFVSYWVS